MLCFIVLFTVPTAIPHVAVRDVELGGYFIPKGALVLFNIASVHTDPEYWQRPLEFDPERWIDTDGTLKKHDAFMPFGIGEYSPDGPTFSIFSKMNKRVFEHSLERGQVQK